MLGERAGEALFRLPSADYARPPESEAVRGRGMLTITGYSDRISVRPGETIKFMVNCEHPTYQADIVRLICADATPAGPGFKEKPVRTPVSKRHKGRPQAIHAGSYALVESRPLLETLGSFTVQAMIWPTMPGKGEQGIVTKWDPRRRTGFALIVDDAGSVALRLGMADGTVENGPRSAKPLLEAPLVPRRCQLRRRVGPRHGPSGAAAALRAGRATAARRSARWGLPQPTQARPSSWPASSSGGRRGARWWTATTTARLDSPRLVGRALDRLEIERMKNEAVPASLAPGHPLRLGFLARYHLHQDLRPLRQSLRTARSSTCPRVA